MRKTKAFVYICVVLCVASMVLFPPTVSAKEYQDLEYNTWSLEEGEKSVYYGEKISEAMEDII